MIILLVGKATVNTSILANKNNTRQLLRYPTFFSLRRNI